MNSTERELQDARRRIQELNEIIVGNRPDLFHDSLVRGSRVSRMEECISTLGAICKYIEDEDNSNDMLDTIHKMATDVIKNNPDFGMYKCKELE